MIQSEIMLRGYKLSLFLIKWAIGYVIILCQLSCSGISLFEEIGSSSAERVFRLNPSSEYDSLMLALKPKDVPNAVAFLWFTDLHRDLHSLRRINAWHDRYLEYFDDMLSTGDQQDTYFTDSFGWWSDEGADEVLQLVGNHDAWISKAMYEEGNYEGEIVSSYGSKSQFWIFSQKDTYNKYLSHCIGLWNVIQPESAREEGKCYYYKDYENLRLIVVDSMHYGTVDDLDENNVSKQDKWFSSILEDARKNSLSVIVASHFPPSNIIPIECSYTYKNSTGRYSDRLNNSAFKRVKSFIDNGGEFVCWLVGHIHDDVLGILEADVRQLVVICASANSYRNTRAVREIGTKAQDSFNCISIDTIHKQIYMVKVGADTNADNERKRIIRYNYSDYLDGTGILHERGLVCSY